MQLCDTLPAQIYVSFTLALSSRKHGCYSTQGPKGNKVKKCTLVFSVCMQNRVFLVGARNLAPWVMEESFL